MVGSLNRTAHASIFYDRHFKGHQMNIVERICSCFAPPKHNASVNIEEEHLKMPDVQILRVIQATSDFRAELERIEQDLIADMASIENTKYSKIPDCWQSDVRHFVETGNFTQELADVVDNPSHPDNKLLVDQIGAILEPSVQATMRSTRKFRDALGI